MRKILKEYTSTHYENKDYTEVVRDTILCMTTEIRNKADLPDGDGVALINKAFSEKDPLIKINNLETDSEKNKQRGIFDMTKGLIEYFRNPMSHDRQEYSKEIADAILTLVDEVILKEVVGSKNSNAIEELYNEIKNENFPNTERYAKTLIASIPQNKKFDLAVLLYRNRAELIGNKSHLISHLTKDLENNKFNEYCKVIENDLFGDIKKENIELALLFINSDVWKQLSDLIKNKIEDMVFLDFSKFLYYTGGNSMKIQGHQLLKNSYDILDLFSNKYVLYNAILNKIVNGTSEESKYLTDNYLNLIINNENEIDKEFVENILKKMPLKSRPAYYRKVILRLEELDKNSKWYKALRDLVENEKDCITI